MKAAVVHDWFQGYHGSERVADAIRELLVELSGGPVDVFTFFAAKELLPTPLAQSIVHQSAIANSSWFRRAIRGEHSWRYLLPYMPRYFRNLDLGAYDVVVSSTHACAAGVRTRSDTLHVCYCHTPMRYLWLPETDSQRFGRVTAAGMRLFAPYLRQADLEASSKPSSYIANSTAVRDRIRRFYGRDAAVIHPPVDVSRFRHDRPRERDHFLWVHRLVTYKRPVSVAEAFRDLPFRLTMVGVGPLEASVRAVKPPNVQLRGWLHERELADLFSSATGFLHVGEEDFGMSMVEALAAGTPVIGLRAGGALDIVRPGADGILIDDASLDSIRAAVHEVAARRWDPTALAQRAERFSSARFRMRFAAHVEQSLRVRRD